MKWNAHTGVKKKVHHYVFVIMWHNKRDASTLCLKITIVGRIVDTENIERWISKVFFFVDNMYR